MKFLIPIIMILALTGCMKKAIYFQSGPDTHGTIEISAVTGGGSINVSGAYVYCSVPLETTLEGRSFTEGFEKFCQIKIDQLIKENK